MRKRIDVSGHHSQEKAVQVRFNIDLVRRMDRVEAHAWAQGRRDVNRSEMIREALTAYLKPLIELSSQTGQSGVVAERFKSREKDAVAFGEAVRVRLGKPLLDDLNQVEAFARSLQFRHVTRSWLVRSALVAFLDGFDSEFPAEQRSTSASTSEDFESDHKVGNKTVIKRRA